MPSTNEKLECNAGFYGSDGTFGAGPHGVQNFNSPGYRLAKSIQQRFRLTSQQADGADVVSTTQNVHVAQGLGEVKSFAALVSAKMDNSGDETVTVDLEKSTDNGASWASVLTAPIEFSFGASTDGVPQTGSLDSAETTYDVGDQFRVVVADNGSGGQQAQGLNAVAYLDENPANL